MPAGILYLEEANLDDKQWFIGKLDIQCCYTSRSRSGFRTAATTLRRDEPH